MSRAVELAPANALILADGARTELAIGHPGEAWRLGDRVVALYSESAWGYAMRAAADLAMGRPQAAIPDLERSLSRDWEDDQVMREAAERMLVRLRLVGEKP